MKKLMVTLLAAQTLTLAVPIAAHADVNVAPAPHAEAKPYIVFAPNAGLAPQASVLGR